MLCASWTDLILAPQKMNSLDFNVTLRTNFAFFFITTGKALRIAISMVCCLFCLILFVFWSVMTVECTLTHGDSCHYRDKNRGLEIFKTDIDFEI